MSLGNMIAITIQTTMGELGFIPDQHGPMVKEIMASEDPIKIMGLGLCLDECRKNKGYKALNKFAKSYAEKYEEST